MKTSDLMAEPKIIVDGLVFENSHQIGIWRVFYEVLSRVSSRADITLWLRAPAVQPLPNNVKIVQDFARAPLQRRSIHRRILRRLQPTVPRKIAYAFDRDTIFHSTYFTYPPTESGNCVTTIYDMIPELLFPIMGKCIQTNISDKRRCIQHASQIISISQATASAITKFFPAVKDRISVVHLGAEHLGSLTREKIDEHEKYSFALFVGNRNSYKNFLTLLDAMTESDWPMDLLLHVVGNPFADHESRLISAMGLSNRIVHRGRLSDNELRSEYRNSKCFIFPSLMEGFGLPLIEAQDNGCPVLCSDIPVFREIAGNSAVYFNPRLKESLTQAVSSFLQPGISKKYIESGHENVTRFSWDKAADETFAVYQEVIDRLQ